MRIRRGTEAGDGGMGLTPLIDVVFLLLIFFVVATSFDEPRLPLALPSAESGASPDERDPLRVELRASGELFVDGGASDLEALDALLAGRPGELWALELRADRAVPHGRVVEVLDRARVHAVAEISIAVEAAGRAPDDR